MNPLGEHPPVDSLRVVRLTREQIRQLLTYAEREWIDLDRERPAMSPREQLSILARQREIEATQETLKGAL